MIRRLALTAALVAGTVTVPTRAEAYAGQCTKYETLLRQQAPRGGWDVNRMSYYMFRESRCLPWVVNRTGGDTGLLQLHPITWPWLSSKFGTPVNRAWLQQPTNNVRAAAALCSFWRRAGSSCYRPWWVR